MFHQELTLAPLASQTSMITLEILHKGTIYNHHTALTEIKGPIDQTVLLKALHAVANRHIILHAKLGENEGRPVFKITTDKELRKKNISFKFIDANHLKYFPNYSPHLLDLYQNLKIIHEEQLIESPFNLHEGPLWRTALIMIDQDHYQLLFVFNHMIIDGQSVANLFKDLSTYYNAYLSEETNHESGQSNLVLPPLPLITDLDFSLDPETYQNRLNYWKENLKDLIPTSLQPDFQTQTSFRFLGKRIRFHLDKSLLDLLLANKDIVHATLNQQLFASLFVLIHRYTDETDICIGIPSANRRSEKIDTIKQLVNCFMNSVPVRLRFSKDCTFSELVLNLHQHLTEGLQNQLPINVIYEKALTVETKSKFNIASPFSILWGMNDKKPELTLNGTLPASYVDLDLGCAKFTNFAINLDPNENGCDGFIEYNSDLFTESRMKRLVGHLKNIIEYSAKHPDCKINEIPFLLEEERMHIEAYNNTYHALPTTLCIHDFFTQLASKYSNNIAIVVHHPDQPQEEMTYGELDARSTRLAFQLRALNLVEGTPVGVCLRRSPQLLVAMLGVMKAGLVFVPLQKCKTAMKGLNHRIDTAEVKLIVTDNMTAPIFEIPEDDALLESMHKIQTINIDKLTETELCNSENITLPTVSLTSPAHIMFTSGSSKETPQPKGVVNTHLGLTNLLGDLILENLEPKEETIIGTAPYDFDAFIYDFLKLLALLSHGKGAQFHICDDATRISPSALNTIIATYKNIFGVFLPRQLALLHPSPNVIIFISMGEKPLDATRLKWKMVNPSIEFRDGFGVSEASICLSTYPINEGAMSGLIGKPIINMQMHILDEKLRPCPIGVPGEIYVSGPGVALGYLKLPDLNELKFVRLSFDKDEFIFKKCEATEGDRFYKTGDFGCYVLTDDGLVVQYKGRKDRQIKIAGVQIDTDLITSVMQKSGLIKDVVLVPNEEGSALIAFIVPENPNINFQDDLKKPIMKALKATLLPRIAYPHTFIEMTTLPYTQNGKVDLKQLPMPERTGPFLLPEKELMDDKPKEPQPTTKMQMILQNFWSQLLSKPKHKIPINKTFEKLGGDSYTLALFEIKINASKKELGLREKIGRDEKDWRISMDILKPEMTLESLELDLKPYLKVQSPPSVILPFNGIFSNGNIVLFPPPPTKSQEQETSTLSDLSPIQTSFRSTKNNNN